MKALKITGIILLILVVLILGGMIYLKFFLPNVGPPPDVKIESTPDRVERGRYLANNVAVCVDCHTSRDWTKFAGPMKMSGLGGGGEKFGPEFGFPGIFYSKNITPYHLGNWTDGEILRAVTEGVNKDGRALFPLMGYDRYGRMDQEDIYSIIAYIKTLPAVKNVVPDSKPAFPVNFLINTMPRKAAFAPRPQESDRVKYGGYLVTMAGCVECHSIREKGEIVPGSEFAGGMEFDFGKSVTRSANITPDKETGIGTWDLKAFLDRFKTYTDSTSLPTVVGEGEPNTPMPWKMYAGMKESDLEAIYTYLQHLKPISHKVIHFEKH